MHKIAEKEFTIEDFSTEHLLDGDVYCYPLGGGWRGLSPVCIFKATIELLNNAREKWIELDKKIKGKEFSGDESVFSMTQRKKDLWWQMIQLLPSSYNQTRNVMLNYEVLANIYRQRKNHKLDEWREVCKWIKTLPYQKLITGEEVTMCDSCKKQYEECHCDCTREYDAVEYGKEHPEFVEKIQQAAKGE